MIVEVQKENRFELSSTSKGNQIKWYRDNTFYKADSMGYESISEALVSELEHYIEGWEEGKTFIDYWLCLIKEGDREYKGCYSKSFLKEGESVISLSRVLESYFPTNNDLDKFFKKYQGKDLKESIIKICSISLNLQCDIIEQYFSNTIKLDSIVLNEDRHLNNISFIRHKDGNYSISPIFDNGLSLLSDTGDFPLSGNYLSMLHRVKARPFSRNFKKQVGYFNTDMLKINYKGFIESINSKTVPFKEKEYNRAKNVLLYQLRTTKGAIWYE